MITSLGAVSAISTSDSTDSSTEKIPLTRDEIAQEVHDKDFKALNNDTQDEIEELYDRQPFADGVSASDLQTRDQLAQSEHDVDEFENLSSETQHEIEETYDAQFADASEKKKYSRDEIADAKYDEDFNELSAETTWEVEELYDRQPFVSFAGTHDPADVLTRNEIANEKYGEDFSDLSERTQHAVEDLYDQQFPFSVTSNTTESKTTEDTLTTTTASEDTPTDTAEDTPIDTETTESTPETITASEDTPADTETTEDTSTDTETTEDSTTTTEETQTTTTSEDTTTTETVTTTESSTTTTTSSGGSAAPAYFEVTGYDISDVNEDGELTITLTVENQGGQSDEQSISITAANETIGASFEEQLQLDPGETGQVSFDTRLSEIGSGVISLSMETENGQIGTSFRAESPSDSSQSDSAFFEVDNYDLTSDGDTIIITAIVENTGDAAGEQTIGMTVGTQDGGAAGDETIALDAGESGEVTYEVDRSELGSGLATLNVNTQDDGLSTTFNVDDVTSSGSALFEIDEYDLSSDGDTIIITGTVENTGDAAGEQTIGMTVGSLSGGDGTSGDETISLESGETGEVTYEVDRSTLGSGTAELNLNSQDDGLSVTFNVDDVVESE